LQLLKSLRQIATTKWLAGSTRGWSRKTAQSLLHLKTATVSHCITRFSSKYSKDCYRAAVQHCQQNQSLHKIKQL